jgi:hypothetical protein
MRGTLFDNSSANKDNKICPPLERIWVMEHKIVTTISIFFLFVAFALVSFLVFLTRRHPYFVSKKLRLGALILSLTGVSVGCIPATCYYPAPLPREDTIYIYGSDTLSHEIVLNRSTSDTISGKITKRRSQFLSYAIFDSLDTIVKKDDVQPSDGVFDSDSEEFKIGLSHSILAGNYDLRFYYVPLDSIKHYDWEDYSFSLKVVDSLP